MVFGRQQLTRASRHTKNSNAAGAQEGRKAGKQASHTQQPAR
jgi:hypothetical protein